MLQAAGGRGGGERTLLLLALRQSLDDTTLLETEHRSYRETPSTFGRAIRPPPIYYLESFR